jgi:GT2 family glycosyltransferase
MRTGIVVLTYNRAEAALAVLRALAPQCGTDDVVVIADDGSRPDQVDALRAGLPRFACPVRHVWHPDVGFTAARARNLGALHARSDYLIFLDGDCVPHPHFVQQHKALARPGAFVNGSRVLLGEALTRKVESGEVELSRLRPLQWLSLRLRGDVNKLSHLLRWTGMPGREERRFRWSGIRSCNFGVWWRDFEAVNGFDEVFSGWGHEDADLVLRLHNQGLVRKNGQLATEVFHLWHRENSRANEAANRQRVLDRMRSRQCRAEIGLAEAGNQSGVVMNELSGKQGENPT